MSRLPVRVALGLSLVIALQSCTRGRPEGEPAPDAGRPAGPAERPAMDEAFREGRLPAGLSEGAPIDGGTLTIRTNVEPAHLMYLIEPDGWLSRIVNHNLNESLVRADPRDHPNYRIIPELAEGWDESADRLTSTFQLRKGVRWHDGRPFTAADVKFTFDRLLDPVVRASSLRSGFEALEKVEVVGEHAVKFTWRRPYVFSLRRLADVPILPAHAFVGFEGARFNDAPYKRAPIGTGPYRFESWVEKTAITLARNDDYWGKKGHVAKVVYRPVEEANVAQQLLLRGEIDLDVNLTSEQYVEAEKEPKLVAQYHRVKTWDSNFGWVGFNLQRALFQDVRVRRALAMLLDREKVRATLLRGVPAAANCVFYHLGPACDPATKQVDFDPAAAAKLLDEAGWRDTDGDGLLDKGGAKASFTVTFPAGISVNEQLLLVWKEQLRKAGVELQLSKIEWSVYTGKLRSHEFDACLLAWMGSIEDDPRQVWHSSQSADGSNYVGYQSPEADALIEQIRAEFDEGKRQALYRRLNARIVEDQPYVLLFHQPKRTLVSRRLRGVYESPIESYQVRDVWIAAP